MRYAPNRALTVCVSAMMSLAGASSAAADRTVVNLDGDWQIAEGALDTPPAQFDHRVPVPGLADMAAPPFADVGIKSDRRDAFWYRRTFSIDGPAPAIARLVIGKAKYGTLVILNGKRLGEDLACFTPTELDARDALRPNGADNELLIRVGANREYLAARVPTGFDPEKKRYIPGIFDSVRLVLTDTPHIQRVQVVPALADGSAGVHIQIRNDGGRTSVTIACTVREALTSKVVGSHVMQPIVLGPHEERTVRTRVPVPDARPWSPEDPFLYELEVRTGSDTYTTRFGMREFRFDRETGRAVLNGRPYYLRGTNVCIFRFFEDPSRADLPWREEWVRGLHRLFKRMHWNATRYCIGFPPEMWYRIADEEGLLIQDEFPIWSIAELEPHAPEHIVDILADQYSAWIRNRWNHPCVVIWDAQNETVTPATGRAIALVRGLDDSARPWDNGWAPAQSMSDCYESHPYLFNRQDGFRLSMLSARSPMPPDGPTPNTLGLPIIINEYGWLWLNRDGTPTRLSKPVYKRLLGTDASEQQLRETYARYLAALTEFWRCGRHAAGVLHFCGLGYSRPGGETSDHFIDLAGLELDPHFVRYVRDAFSPVGLMIDWWSETLPRGRTARIEVVVINDRHTEWSGPVSLQLVGPGGRAVFDLAQPCALPALGQTRLAFEITTPDKPGAYQLVATIRPGPGPDAVHSVRDVSIGE
jgi:beta-galactosidase